MSSATIEVLVTPHGLEELDLERRSCVVIDVLRAGTTIAFALAAGARAVIPVESVEAAIRLGQTLDLESTLLGGERANRRVDGFHLGNSPGEYTAEAVADKTIVLSTTNGAKALARVSRARDTVAAALPNVSACARFLADRDRVTIVCAGSGPSFSLEDFVCAGRIVDALVELRPGARVDDGARAAVASARRHSDLRTLLESTDHGRVLQEQGYGADLGLAAELDRFDDLPVLREGALVATAV